MKLIPVHNVGTREVVWLNPDCIVSVTPAGGGNSYVRLIIDGERSMLFRENPTTVVRLCAEAGLDAEAG
jgi:hypothetical protein